MNAQVTFKKCAYQTLYAYDSSRYWLPEAELPMLIGQSVFVLPLIHTSGEAGYEGFYNKLPKFTDFDYQGNGQTLKNYAAVFAPNPAYPQSSQALALSGTSWLVDGVEKISEPEQNIEIMTFLRLKNDKGVVIYWKEGRSVWVQIPFVVQGFYEKTKQNYLNKAFLVTKKLALKDFEKGNTVILKQGDELKVQKMMVAKEEKEDARFGTLGFLFSTATGATVFLNYKSLERSFDYYNLDLDNALLSKSYKTDYKISEAHWQAMCNNKGAKDMSPRLVRLLWGDPGSVEMEYSKNKPVTTYRYGYETTFLFINNALITNE
jgi:hypothetical protein